MLILEISIFILLVTDIGFSIYTHRYERRLIKRINELERKALKLSAAMLDVQEKSTNE